MRSYLAYQGTVVNPNKSSTSRKHKLINQIRKVAGSDTKKGKAQPSNSLIYCYLEAYESAKDNSQDLS